MVRHARTGEVVISRQKPGPMIVSSPISTRTPSALSVACAPMKTWLPMWKFSWPLIREVRGSKVEPWPKEPKLRFVQDRTIVRAIAVTSPERPRRQAVTGRTAGVMERSWS